MPFDHWLSLSDAERATAQQQWNVYGDGYWHSLVALAAERFASEFTSRPHVRSITHGIYHDGEPIIGVTTDLPYPKIIRLPESYLGFRVMQFAGGTPEGPLSHPLLRFTLTSNQSLQLTAGRSGASHWIMKTHPFQSTLASASGS